MLQNVNFDFSSFEDVPSPQSRTTYRLTFSAGNKLCQNDAFHRALQGITDFHLQLSSDGHFLRLDPNGPNNLTLQKTAPVHITLWETCSAVKGWNHPYPILCAGGKI